MKIILMRLRITIAMLEMRNRETLQSKVNICKSDVKTGDYADSLRSDKTCYWKASRAIRKNNFNCTNVLDGVEGGSKIANLFKDKYERLFNSVKCSEVDHNLLATNICKETECTHIAMLSGAPTL